MLGTRCGVAARRLAALAAVALVAAGCGRGAPGGDVPAVTDPIEVARTGKWNDALVCPEGACAAADRASPVYPVGAERLADAWRGVVAGQPRTTLEAWDPGRMLLLARQRSAVFRFVDTVAVRILPGPTEGTSSFAAYSSAGLGFYDFGVNRRRLRDWQALVERDLGVAGLPAEGG